MKSIKLKKFKKPDYPLEVYLKGSKSYTNRALILACLANGKSYLKNASDSDDTHLLVKGLNQLGFSVKFVDSTIEVNGGVESILPKKVTIDIGPAGTVMRFLTGLISAIPGLEVELRGSERMHQRPIADLVDALRQMGAKIEYLGTAGCPPLKIIGEKLRGAKVSLNGNVSSQYFSALMLTASLYENPLEINVVGTQTSASYIDMTIKSLKDFGVNLENDAYQNYKVNNLEVPKAIEYLVEGDASGASYFWGLGALTAENVRVYNLSIDSIQGDIKFLDIMKEMGCEVRHSNSAIPWTEVKGINNLKAVETNMDLLPDTAQTLAVIASFAEGNTKITGLHTLRHKETDRIQAVVNELRKSGIETRATDDSLEVIGGQPRAATYDTYEDHRMAMSFALISARLDNIIINEPEVVNKSFPTFFNEFQRLGIKRV